jgi:L-fucose mutarotase
MLKQKLLHPEILGALAAAGHNSMVLIADGNFPFSTALGPRAKAVYLNLSPGVVSVTQALEAVVSAVMVDAAAVMKPATSGPYAMKKDPPAWNDFKKILKATGFEGGLKQLEIKDFYELAACGAIALTIATGDQRWYSNVLLTIGAVQQK